MILVIDNYDSFTFNLVQLLGELGADPVVRRNDAVGVEEIAQLAPQAIVVSPGPCAPAQAGVSVPVIRRWGGSIPILGVCLGHQSIAEAYGGRVIRAGHVMHGKTSAIRHDGSGLFRDVPDPAQVMRYHSLVMDPHQVPADLEVIATAETDPGEIHAVKHRAHPVWGVQFHPESIMTPDGRTILRNFLDMAR